MMRLTPVTDSKARMLRPSRPMMRPFISSPGRCSTETTDSLVCSVATRWMARVTILRARFSPSDLASCSISRTMRAASRLAWFSIVATSSALAWSAVRPATRSSSLAAFGVGALQVGGAPVEVLLALVESLGAVFDALELLVQPLLAVGEAGFPALEVTAQLTHLVLDRADLLFDLAAALGGLLGFLAGSLQDAGGFGLGAGADVFGFGGGAVELVAVGGLGERVPGGIRGPAPDDDEREYHREQPDYHERERQSAAHGHPFPSIALGAPLCCDYLGTRGLCPGAGGRTPRRPQLIFRSASGQLDYTTYPLAAPPWSAVCSLRQHLAAVRLRVYNLFIKQSIFDRSRTVFSWTNGAMPAACGDGGTRNGDCGDWAASPDCCGS